VAAEVKGLGMTRRFRVGLIGYGAAGRFFHAPLIGAVEGLELAAVVSGDAARVAACLPDVRVLAGPDALLADPDIDLVVIATPNRLHAPLARAALEQGRNVVVEKPITETWAEAKGLADLAAERGLLLSAFHNRRWDGDFLTLRRLTASGELGRPVELESRFDRFRPHILGRWREQAGLGAGVWFDLGPHLLDQALMLFGRPEWLWADIAAVRERAVVDDEFHVVLGYPGLRVVLRSSTLQAAETPRFSLACEGGAFVKYGLDPQEAVLRRGERPGGPGWGADPRHGVVSRGVDRLVSPLAAEPGDWRRYYEGVRDALAGAGPNPVTPAQACEVMALLELARESSASGRRLVLSGDERLVSASPWP
jgi:predicted dehydrogenase